MCGIVGYWCQGGDRADMRTALATACDTMRHRGPDGGGVWFSGSGVAFGHRRLSILDLSQAGAQPMVSRDGKYVIIFNGEIYNFAEIARELASKGHIFQSHSDTEIVIASFREWGASCVERFIGMFAFAVWDEVNQCLSICRDRVGVKPLYYIWDGRILAFASELKALRALPHWRPEIDFEAVGEFLQYGYIGQPRSIYQNVRKLPPACWLKLDLNAAPSVELYWNLKELVASGPLEGTDRDLEDKLESLLVDAVRYRLVSDVPVGLFLSGGVDSSLVAALLKRANVEIETFTIGFKSARHDESTSAAAVSQELGFRNYQKFVDEQDAKNVLDKWPDLYDEPFGDPSGIPTYLVSQIARERVGVALSADGGDEQFCGYSGYVEAAERMRRNAMLPRWFRKAGMRGVDLALVGASTLSSPGHFLDRIHKVQGYLDGTGINAIRPFRSFWQPSELRQLLGSSYTDPRLFNQLWRGSRLEQLAAMDFTEYLPDDVLCKTDRASMAVGLECREPLLDHRVVEMAFRLPMHLRLGKLGNKHILRSILYRYVPRPLVDRPKQGFAVPISDWMDSLISNGTILQTVDILSRKLRIDQTSLQSVVNTYKNTEQGKFRLWLLYVLGRWAQRWV